ncbi:MAG: SagB/ThcOx family dehydrogenase [Candidatus Acetothermia bacterium]|jgi:SagB-type dehydrogenase family enzyme|nr:SagB/ThcOx family dehydrogenase [Candidatus Acetothermia bacterium]MDH7505019.1 SagB/ThcOx family dehydrogenase [Candidatus Acetothermia bacterium]
MAEYQKFHRASSHTRERLFLTPRTAARGPAPELRKDYQAEAIRLPPVEPRGMSLEEAIRRRRSIREYSREPISLEELARLLFYGVGVTGPAEYKRAAPTAGGLTPIELYPVVNNVVGLDRGLYHYDPLEHHLHLLKRADLRREIARACLEQDFLADAAAVIVLTAVHRRTAWKYGERAYRYILLDAGHAAENIQLEATALGLGSCPIGAFFDDELNRLLGLEGEEQLALLAVAVGRWRASW